MPKELTYEEAIERLLISCEQAFSEFSISYNSDTTYKGYMIFKSDYKAIKVLEEAIEKAKKYDKLNKEKEDK